MPVPKSTDIVTSLRRLSACDAGCRGRCAECPDDVARDAADEIERLRDGILAFFRAHHRAEKDGAEAYDKALAALGNLVPEEYG